MSKYGIRYDPTAITLVIISMFYPDAGKKMLSQSGLKISDKTIQRIKKDLEKIGINKLIKESHKLYLWNTVGSVLDTAKLKNFLFSLLYSADTSNLEKIKTAKVLQDVIKNSSCLYDPILSESIPMPDGDKNAVQSDAVQETKENGHYINTVIQQDKNRSNLVRKKSRIRL